MIIHGYSEEELKKLPDNSVDLIITSPPYADRRKNTYGGISEDKYVEWFKPIAIEVKRVLKPTGSFFLNIKPHTNKGERSLYVFYLEISKLFTTFVKKITYTHCYKIVKNMEKEETKNNEKYSIPIYENGVKTEWTIDGVIGDEKYFELLKYGNGKELPDMVNVGVKK